MHLPVLHIWGSGCGGSCDLTQVLMFFLPPPLLCCPLVDPRGTVCHHQPWVPCQRQMGIREWSTSPFLSPPTDLERRGWRSGNFLRVHAWMVDPNPAVHITRLDGGSTQQSKSCRVVCVPRKPHLPESWCVSRRTVENAYFLHAESSFSPALGNSMLGPFLSLSLEPLSPENLDTEPWSWLQG